MNELKDKSNKEYLLLIYYLLSGIITSAFHGPNVAMVMISRYRWLNLSYKIEFAGVYVGNIIIAVILWLRLKTKFKKTLNIIPFLTAGLLFPINIIAIFCFIVNPNWLILSGIRLFVVVLLFAITLAIQINHIDDGEI